jgi:hypothetical protein
MRLATEVRAGLADPARSSVADIVKAQAQIDWILWSRMAGDLDRQEAEVRASDAPPLIKQVEISALPADLGRQIKVSEFTVARIAAQARRLRDHTPTVWEAFSEGRVDEAKAREIASAVEKLDRPASIVRLDRQVVAYAETHTVVELRRWLKVFIARVESDLFTERAERARADRGVDVVHGEDGMSQLFANLASMDAAAINYRLTKQARALGADDPRTMDQRKADLLTAWLTTNQGEATITANIAVTMTGATLAGADNYPAVSADGTWIVPAPWILDLAKNNPDNVFWHRMILDPVTDNVLAHEYKGRFAPDVLTQALQFRDGVCQAPGCCKPAHLCDIDHRIPHQIGGPTTGWNTGPYCRRHHIRKGFGLIDTGPTTTSPPGHSRNTPLHTIGMPQPSLELKVRTRIDLIRSVAA